MKVGYFSLQEFVEELRRLAQASKNLLQSAMPKNRTRRGYTVRRHSPSLTLEERKAKEGHA